MIPKLRGYTREECEHLYYNNPKDYMDLFNSQPHLRLHEKNDIYSTSPIRFLDDITRSIRFLEMSDMIAKTINPCGEVMLDTEYIINPEVGLEEFLSKEEMEI